MTHNMSSLLLILIYSIAVGSCGAQNSVQDYVDTHNAARAAVGVGKATWSAELETYANGYVRTRLSDCELVHSKGPYGENLAWGTGPFSGTDAVKLWTDEEPCYNYSNNTCSASPPKACEYGCLHYTQVVWRNSTRLGCARLQCANGAWFVSCNYDPPGNYVGEKPY